MKLKTLFNQTMVLGDHKVKRCYRQGEEIIIELERRRRKKVRCKECGGRGILYGHMQERRWRHVDLWGKRVYVTYQPYRIQCQKCGVHVEAMSWSRGKQPWTIPFMVMVGEMAKKMALKEVARRLGISWGAVANIIRAMVEYGKRERDVEGVRRIGIDEVSRQKGHVYHTVVYDLEGKRVLWSGNGRGEHVLRAFYQEMGEAWCARIEYAVMDMWPAYRKATETHLPNAVIVYDKFHVMKHLHDALEKVRRDEMKGLNKQERRELKGVRWALLKRPCLHTARQKTLLERVVRSGMRVGRAWALKEGFYKVMEASCEEEALSLFRNWFWRATHSRLEPMRCAAWTIKRHLQGIFASLWCELTNAVVEGLNNNIKVLARQARGFRTPCLYDTLILHRMGKLPPFPWPHAFF